MDDKERAELNRSLDESMAQVEAGDVVDSRDGVLGNRCNNNACQTVRMADLEAGLRWLDPLAFARWFQQLGHNADGRFSTVRRSDRPGVMGPNASGAQWG